MPRRKIKFITALRDGEKKSNVTKIRERERGGGGFATKPRIRFEFVWTHAQCMPTFRVNACAVHAWSLYHKHGDECARRLRVPRIEARAALQLISAAAFLSMWCRSLVFFFLFFCSSEVALMHVTSWSESYPLRNSLMCVRGFRPVFSSVSFCSQTTCSARLGKAKPGNALLLTTEDDIRGASLRGRDPGVNEEVTLACRWGLRRWRKANLQIVKRYVKVCSSSQSSFFDATTIEEVMATWLLSEEVFETYRHFDDRQSWESVQEFTQVCTTEWIAFRRSVQEWIICGVQNYGWRVGQLWAPAEGLTTSPPRTSGSCSVDGQFNELWSGLLLLYACYTCILLMWVLDYVINLEQLHFGPHLHVILVKFSFSKCSLLRHAA